MNKTRWWLLLLAVLFAVGGLLAVSCGPSGGGTPSPTGTPTEWVPEVPGMKQGEEKLFFDWRAGLTSNDERGSQYYTYWFSELDKRTKGHMKVTPYYSGAIGSRPELPWLTNSGVIEICQYSTLYFQKEMPIDVIINMPFFLATPPSMTELNEALVWGGTMHPISQQDMMQINLLALGHFGQYSPYEFYTRKGVTLTKADDWKGKMMRAPGYMATLATQLGAIPVSSAAVPNAYEAFQKGMLDITAVPPTGIAKGGVWEVTEGLLDRPLSRGHFGTAVNLEKWNALPQYIKDIQAALVPDVQKFSREESLLDWDESMKFIKEKGIKFFDMPDSEWAKVVAAGKVAYEEWHKYAKSIGVEKRFLDYYSDMIIIRNKYLEKTEGKWTLYLPPGLKPEVYPK